MGADRHRDVRILHPAVEERLQRRTGRAVQQPLQSPVTIALLRQVDVVLLRFGLEARQLPVRIDVLDDPLTELGKVLERHRRGQLHQRLLDSVRILRPDRRRKIVDRVAESLRLIRGDAPVRELLRYRRTHSFLLFADCRDPACEVVAEAGPPARFSRRDPELPREQTGRGPVSMCGGVADPLVVGEHVRTHRLDESARRFESANRSQRFLRTQRSVTGRSRAHVRGSVEELDKMRRPGFEQLPIHV